MHKLLLVGCGKMGSILLTRWKNAVPDGIERIAVIDPGAKQKQIAGCKIYPSIENLPDGFSPTVIVFAIKPQDLASTIPLYGARFGRKPLYLSVAAGKTAAFIASYLPANAPVVRAMPNLPARIGESITALHAPATVSATHKKSADALMSAIGKTLWIKDENWMDGITAIAGSGPAYLFLFMEALTQAGVECGLDPDIALQLVRQTVKGAALLAEQNDCKDLRTQVTSPGGTTEAALSVLLDNNRFKKLISEAVQAAARRAVELENIDISKK